LAIIVKLRFVPTTPVQGESGMPIAKVIIPPPSATAEMMTMIASVLFCSTVSAQLFLKRLQEQKGTLLANRALANSLMSITNNS